MVEKRPLALAPKFYIRPQTVKVQKHHHFLHAHHDQLSYERETELQLPALEHLLSPP